MSCERYMSKVAVTAALAVAALLMLAPASGSRAQSAQAAQAVPSDIGKDGLKTAPSDSAPAASG